MKRLTQLALVSAMALEMATGCGKKEMPAPAAPSLPHGEITAAAFHPETQDKMILVLDNKDTITVTDISAYQKGSIDCNLGTIDLAAMPLVESISFKPWGCTTQAKAEYTAFSFDAENTMNPDPAWETHSVVVIEPATSAERKIKLHTLSR